MTESPKQYFSGSTLGQALVAASESLGLPPDRIRYVPIEGRHTSWKGTRRIVIAVDPASPELPLVKAEPVAVAARERAAASAPRPEPRPVREPKPPANESEQAVIGAVSVIVRLSGLDLAAEAEGDESGVDVELFGRDGRRAVGRHGEVLRAVEHLAGRFVGERFPVRVDCDGFRQRQDRALEELAREACAEVEQSGGSVLLDAMSPPERRIVHVVVKAAGLRSESRGDGFLKRVEVLPALPEAVE